VTKFPKKADFEKRVVIAYDEFNNGMPFPNENMPYIGVTYTRLPENGELNISIGKKHGFSKDKIKRRAFRSEAIRFLRQHKSFKYFTIRRSEDWVYFELKKTIAIARLICESAITVIEKNPLIIIDGRKPLNAKTQKTIEDIIKQYELPELDMHFRIKADVNYLPARMADRIAYCLGALRYGNGGGKWPYRINRIDLSKEPTILEEYGQFIPKTH